MASSVLAKSRMDDDVIGVKDHNCPYHCFVAPRSKWPKLFSFCVIPDILDMIWKNCLNT